jgi:hypothetical protein
MTETLSDLALPTSLRQGGLITMTVYLKVAPLLFRDQSRLMPPPQFLLVICGVKSSILDVPLAAPFLIIQALATPSFSWNRRRTL